MEYAAGDDPKVFCTVTIKSLGLLGLQSDFSVSIRPTSHMLALPSASLFTYFYLHTSMYTSTLHHSTPTSVCRTYISTPWQCRHTAVHGLGWALFGEVPSSHAPPSSTSPSVHDILCVHVLASSVAPHRIAMPTHAQAYNGSTLKEHGAPMCVLAINDNFFGLTFGLSYIWRGLFIGIFWTICWLQVCKKIMKKIMWWPRCYSRSDSKIGHGEADPIQTMFEEEEDWVRTHVYLQDIIILKNNK
jgi:hypothetical protein